jgi:hypothetical protein
MQGENMTAENSEKWIISVCGLNCAKCDIYQAGHGNMMLCAKERRLQHCFQCEDFPCTNINEFSSDGISHHKRTIENSKRMKEIGIEAWIEEQKRKGQCVFCP